LIDTAQIVYKVGTYIDGIIFSIWSHCQSYQNWRKNKGIIEKNTGYKLR